jgi:hypothetical protein
MRHLPTLALAASLMFATAACNNPEQAGGGTSQSVPENQGMGGVADGAPGGTNAPANAPSPATTPSSAGATTPAPQGS